MTHIDVLVTSSAHDVRDARLQRIVTALLASGLEVEVLALGVSGHAPPGAHHASVPGHGWIGRLVANVVVLTRPAHVLIVLDPDLAITALAWRFLHRGAVVSDVHEDYSAVVHDRRWVRPGWRRVVHALARVSTRASAAADLTAVADTHVPPHRARRRVVVRNLPARDELPVPAEPGAVPRAIYVGDLRRSRGLYDMVEAVLAVDEWELDLIGPIADSDRVAVTTRLEQAGASHRVRLHGRLPVREAWGHASGAWVGFALLHDTPAFRRATPTKLYEYVGTGVPVMVSNLPPLRDFVGRTHAGVVTQGLDDVVARLREWREHPARLRPLHDAARSWQGGLVAHSPFGQLADEVSRLVSTQRKAAA